MSASITMVDMPVKFICRMGKWWLYSVTAVTHVAVSVVTDATTYIEDSKEREVLWQRLSGRFLGQV